MILNLKDTYGIETDDSVKVAFINSEGTIRELQLTNVQTQLMLAISQEFDMGMPAALEVLTATYDEHTLAYVFGEDDTADQQQYIEDIAAEREVGHRPQRLTVRVLRLIEKCTTEPFALPPFAIYDEVFDALADDADMDAMEAIAEAAEQLATSLLVSPPDYI